MITLMEARMQTEDWFIKHNNIPIPGCSLRY
jgi:hypothetical protein